MTELNVKEFLGGYLAEAEEHLSVARRCVVALDEAIRRGEHSPKSVRELFRALHTLKGLSAMVGAEPIVDVTHELETLLRTADRAGGRLAAQALDVTVEGLRVVEDRVGKLGRGEPLPPIPQSLLERLTSLGFASAPGGPTSRPQLELDADLMARLALAEAEQLVQGAERGERVVQVEFHPSQARAEQGLNITSVRERLGKVGEIVKVIPRSVAAPAGSPGIAFLFLMLTRGTDEAIAQAAATSAAEVRTITVRAPTATEAEETPAAPDTSKRSFVRVEVSRLDDALEGLSALVVTRSRLERAVSRAARGEGGWREVDDIVNATGKQLRALRSAILRARMVPVAELLDRVPLLVRGLTQRSEKRVRLTIDAGASELDKAVGDRLFPAIVHLLRNAIDHAVETVSERRAAGKPEEAQLSISCVTRSASQLTIVIADDGRGIDRERVAQRAQAPLPTDDNQLLALITRPGLSTLDQATHTSGRGLGMDIVKRIVVTELGGGLQLETQKGKGTRFTLTVPLSVSILDVFSFVVSQRTFVVPVSAVEDLAEIEAAKVTVTPSARPGFGSPRLFEHRGEALPLFDLSQMLGQPGEKVAHPKAIIVRREADAAAFAIDQLLGQQEVVVRPIVDPLVNVQGVAGSTDLGDGQPTLVLDLLSLMNRTTAEGVSV
ncbi:MAG: chemotaxis protein CheW [Myxococcaceae bacterium]